MTRCPLCKMDLEVDNIGLESHLADLHGNRVEAAKALANILERLEQIERNVEKISWFYGLTNRPWESNLYVNGQI